jgi:peptidase E
MSSRPKRIIALGGGGFSMEPGNPLLDDALLEATGVDHPRVLFIPTASGHTSRSASRAFRVELANQSISRIPLVSTFLGAAGTLMAR